MAEVRLGRYQAEQQQLPGICMCCGAPAATYQQKEFSWFPSWITFLILAGFVPYLIVSNILAKRIAIAAPLCNRHVSYWKRRFLITRIGMLAVVLLGIVLVAGLLTYNALAHHRDSPLHIPFLIGWLVLFLAWPVVIIVMDARTIRPLEITDRSITLTGVAPEFAAAARTGP